MVVIGVGNEFRRDDGAGPAVVARLRDLAPPGVRLVVTDGEPARLVEAWTGAALAVVVDAVRAEPARPGTVHRFAVDAPGSGPGITELERRSEENLRKISSLATHLRRDNPTLGAPASSPA